MEDTVYRVKTKYELDTKEAEHGVDALAEKFESLKKIAEFALVTLGIEKLIDKAIELGSEVENTRIKLAGMMNAGGASGANDFNMALRMSGQLIEDIREKAAKVPGTWQDVARIVNTAIVPGLRAGHSINDITDLALKAQGVGKLNEMDSGTSAHSLTMMLRGTARSMDPMFNALRPMMDNQGEGFNKLGGAERYEQILKALDKFKPALDEQAKGWTAISTTTKNYVELVEESLTGALFNSLKESLAGVNEWFERNKATIFRYAEVIGKDLGRAFLFAVDQAITLTKAVSWVSDHFSTLATVVGYVATVYGVYSAAQGIAILLQSGAVISQALLTAGMYGVIGAVGIWTVLQEGLNIAVASNPIMAFTVVIGVMVAALATAIAYMDELRESFENMIDIKPMRWMMKKAGFIPEGATDADMDEMAKGRDSEGNRRFQARQAAGRNDFASRVMDNSSMSLILGDAALPEPVADMMKKTKSMEDMLNLKARENLEKTTAAKGNVHNTYNIKQEFTINESNDPDRVQIVTRKAIDDALHHPIESGRNRFSTLR